MLYNAVIPLLLTKKKKNYHFCGEAGVLSQKEKYYYLLTFDTKS